MRSALLKYGSDRALAMRRLDEAEDADTSAAEGAARGNDAGRNPESTTAAVFGAGRAASTGSRAASDRARRGRR